MTKKILYLLSLLFLIIKTNSYATSKDDSLNVKSLSESKFPAGAKQDTLHYTLPFLTIHLGGSIGLSSGSATINSENSLGTKVNFKNDLGFPSSAFFPRINIILATTQKMQFIFDFNVINIKKTAVTPKDLTIGNISVPSNTSLKSQFNMVFANGAYRNSFLIKKHFNIGWIAGLDLHQYTLKIRNVETDKYQKTSFAVWTPLVGLDIFGFLHKDFFFRGTLNFTALPFHNYDLTQISFKSYIEYYIIKNVGLGVSYNSFYSDIRQLSKLNGSLLYQIHSVSLFASFRFY